MANFYIADPHFGHERIIEICNRPFTDVEDMNKQLIEKWNSKVTNEDTVYILGDFCFKMSKQDAIKILKQLNGKKILVRGNHDKYAGQRDFDECFEKVCDYLQVAEDKLQIILSHYPIIDYAGMYYGAKMIYGHIHDKYVRHKNMYCVSVECVNYEPVTLKEIEDIYKDKYVHDNICWAEDWNLKSCN